MAKYRALRRALRYLVWFVYKRVVTLLSLYFQPNSLSSAVILFAKAQSAMTLENAGIMSAQVRPPFWLAGRASRPVFVLPRPIRVVRPSCFWQVPVVFGLAAARGGWYACCLLSDTAPHYLCWLGATRQLQLDRTRTIHPPASVLGLPWPALQRGDPSQIASDLPLLLMLFLVAVLGGAVGPQLGHVRLRRVRYEIMRWTTS